MNIAIAQMQVISGAFEQNRTRMLDFAKQAKDGGARLAIFPAHALSGGCSLDDADQEGFLSDIVENLQAFADEAPLDCVIPLMGELAGMPLFEVALVHDHAVRAMRIEREFKALKRGILGGGDDDDENDLISFELDGLRFAVAFTFEDLDYICDLGHAYDVVIYAATYGFSHDNPSTQLAAALTETRLIHDADRIGAWLVAAGSLGVFDTQVYSGGSFILAPWGELAAEAPSFEETLVTYDIDPRSEGPLSQPLVPDVPDRLLMLMDSLIFGLTGFCQAEGVRDVAIVMDGSLISSYLATLACDALGPVHVHAVVGGAETPELDAAARELAARLRLDATMAPDGATADQVEAMRAELVRTSGALPLINLDKTGFCLENRAGTLTVGGLAPLGDVYRSDVVALARLRNTISPVIGETSMRAWQVPRIEGMAQRYLTAESQLEFIDYVLSGRLEWGRTYTQIVEDDRGGAVAEQVLECMRIRRMARLSPPHVLIVSSRSLLESPQAYGLRWHDHVREHDLIDMQQIGSYLQSLGAPRENAVPENLGQELKDAISFLRDFAFSGELFNGVAPIGGMGDENNRRSRPGDGGDAWSFGNPFSEN